MSTWQNRYSTPSVHIGDLQVAPDFRNCGLGSFALATLIAQATLKGDQAVTLNVFFDNPALSLYERHGFEPITFDADKIRMRRVLSR